MPMRWVAGFSIALLCGICQPAWGGEPSATPEAAERVAKQKITGTFMAATKRMVSVEIPEGKDATVDLAMSIGPDVQLHNVKALAELKHGDTVTVAYEQTYRDDGKGGRVILKTEAKHVVLVSRAAPRPVAAEEAAGGAHDVQ